MKLRIQISLPFVFMLISLVLQAQDKEWIHLGKQYEDGYLITNPHQEIHLDTIVLFPKPKFTNNYDRRYYAWFRKKTYKAYPYAVLAKEKLDSLNASIDEIESSRKRRRYIKDKQKLFEEQFAEDVKKLTRTEGRILIKLIHRLTGETVNEHIQDKRGKFKAFWYRFSASFFKIDLDLEYHPENVMEDYMIENILQQAFLYGQLERHPSVLMSGKLPLPVREIHIEKKK
ncbi:DUF4294 domain-containing protein [Wenyingzhuangia fucanilytica]|nr:DUF4294 domain-containing protein [Wenyingzhuangia fucanilytica]